MVASKLQATLGAQEWFILDINDTLINKDFNNMSIIGSLILKANGPLPPHSIIIMIVTISFMEKIT